MRFIVLITCLALIAFKAACQQVPIAVPADDTLLYHRAIMQYEQGNFSRAEGLLRKAFKRQPGEETAHYLYYSLQLQGYDLEAADFQQKHYEYAFVIPAQRKGLENIYIDIGPRIAANNHSGNLLYGDVGAFCRLSSRIRLWQAVTYLKQDEDLGKFKQYEYYVSLITYLGRGWYTRPSFYYNYVPYTFVVRQTANVSYTATYPFGRRDTLVYKTNAVQDITFTSPGRTHFLNLSLPVSKRIGALVIESEPAIHYIPGSSAINVSYISKGTTDSFMNNRYEGSKPFTETGSSTRDTVYSNFVAQAGVAAGYRFPIPGEPLMIRGAAYSMRNDQGTTAFAYHISAVLRWRKAFRLYLTWLHKGELPLALNTEGMYFNFNDPIKTRTDISFQLFPLRHFSPIITYQYEYDIRLQDAAPLIYHSCYLSLKYSL